MQTMCACNLHMKKHADNGRISGTYPRQQTQCSSARLRKALTQRSSLLISTGRLYNVHTTLSDWTGRDARVKGTSYQLSVNEPGHARSVSLHAGNSSLRISGILQRRHGGRRTRMSAGKDICAEFLFETRCPSDSHMQ